MDIYDDLKKAVTEFDGELAKRFAKKIIEDNLDLLKAVDVMTAAIRKIGEEFRNGDLYLPDLIGASSALLKAMPLIEEELLKEGKQIKNLGTVVIGTVYGDIHSIGKTMVATLMTAAGFIVHDLGVNLKPVEFIDALKKYNADVLAMSALMTTTAPEQKKVIDELKKEGLRNEVKVIVGGAAITQEFAEDIGADGYDPTSPGAVDLVKKILKM